MTILRPDPFSKFGAKLPNPRTPFSTGEAISVSSPSGRVSERSKQTADNRLRDELFAGIDDQGNNIDTCDCEECTREKEYYIALILASVEEDETSNNLDLYV